MDEEGLTTWIMMLLTIIYDDDFMRLALRGGLHENDSGMMIP